MLANQAKVPEGLTLITSNCGILGTWPVPDPIAIFWPL
jgi:hypothetical protein